MNDALVHDWRVTPSEAIDLQKKLASCVIRKGAMPIEACRLIAGVDVSSSKDSNLLTAGIVVWDRIEARVIVTASAQVQEEFPYVPGLLSFREIPSLLEAAKGLSIKPDVWMVDGQGIAHPRRLGIASHLGILLDVPTLGVAKHILCGTATEPGIAKGSLSPLMHKGEQIGTLVRTKDKVASVIVSQGHRIDQTSAVTLALDCARGYRLPEPTRLAHLFVNEVRKEWLVRRSQPMLTESDE